MVTIGNFFFQSVHNGSQNPAVDTVAVGGTVEWTWAAGSHGVESLGSPSFPNSSIGVPPFAYNVQFNTAGTYHYQCLVHLGLMTGTIVVQ